MALNRQKLTTVAVAVFVFGSIGYLAVRSLLLSPLDEMDQREQRLTKELRMLKTANLWLGEYRNQLADYDARTFGSEEYPVRAALDRWIHHLGQRSGLEQSLSVELQLGSASPKAYREIVASIQAAGSMDQVLHFLYLLREDPYLSRVRSMNIRETREGLVTLRVQYATLVLLRGQDAGADPDEVLATTRRPTSQPAGNLNSPQREVYDAIAARNVFRPYQQRRVVRQTPRRDPPRNDPPTRQPTPTPPARRPRYLLVSLSGYVDNPDICIYDVLSRQVTEYKVGEDLDPVPGAKIAMVDYRSMPLPDKPEFTSTSRIVLKIGPEYWAVELGQHLMEKRLLKAAQLPEQLKPAASSAPAVAGADTTDGDA